MTDVAVVSEPRTYERHGDHSYFADLAVAALPGHVSTRAATARLLAHANEVRLDARDNTPTGLRLRRALMDVTRSPDGAGAHVLRSELRALTTGAGSAGAFVVPQYLVEDTVPYRTYGRAFVDQTNLLPLADSGMTVYLPTVTSAASTGPAAEGGVVVETSDPTATNLSGAVQTAAGQVTVSQALLDRQQDASADLAVQAQLTMAYNTNLDAAVVTAALAGAGTVTDTGTLSIANVWTDVSKAQAQMMTAAGVVLPATHTFFPILEWSWLTAQIDGAGRPIIEPRFSSPVVTDEPAPVGDCGYRLVGTKVFRDGNLPTSGGNGQLVVAHMPAVWCFEGAPVMRAFPETLAGQLSVVLQRYSYWAVIVAYPTAVVSVTGAAYPVNPTI
jgi:hypothetical protein